MNIRTTFAIVVVAASTVSHADLVGNLYLVQPDQQTARPNGITADRPEMSTVRADIVTIGGAGWNISDIQEAYYFQTPQFGFANSVSSALLTISKFNGTPSPQHTTSASTGTDIVYSHIISGTWALQWTNDVGTAKEYNFDVNTSTITALQGLLPGLYLVSLSTLSSFNNDGMGNVETKDNAPLTGWERNPGGGYGFPTGNNWHSMSDGFTRFTSPAMGIGGTTVVPEPGSLAVLGIGMAFFVRRKRTKI